MIEGRVNGQHLELSFDVVVSDSVKYLTIKFICDDSWNGAKRKAIFTLGADSYAVVLDKDNPECTDENTCIVPFEVIRVPGFTVGLIGTEGDKVITTLPCFVPVLKSGELDGAEPKGPTPDQYAQIIDICAAAQQVAASVRADADNGLFKGEKGDKGDKGEKGPEGIKGDRGPEGKQGPVGPTGPQGEKGEKGDTGEKGDKGDNGLDGNVDYSLVANTLKGKKSGESVSISDVSPLEHNLSVKVENSESLMISGKNLFNVHSMTNLGTSIKKNGITATILENGGVRVTGTPEDNTIATSITFLGSKGIILPAGIYSAEPEGIVSGAKIQCFVQARDINGSHLANFNKEAITIAQKFYMDRFLVYIDKGVTEAIDETFYPCIEKNDKCTGYEPYVEPITYSVNADGTVHGVKSSCFGMTFLADTEGAVIEVEYNRDINKALAQLEAALINFGGAEVE